MRKPVFGICGQRRSRSECAFAQSDQDLRCPLKESFDSINVSVESKCLNETAHARDESEPVHFAHVFRMHWPIWFLFIDKEG